MKKALLLFAMFAFIGTAYTANASIGEVTGVYCDHGDGHKCDDKCKKECKKSKKKGCSKASAAKKGCCAKKGESAKGKSCHDKSKSSTSNEDKK